MIIFVQILSYGLQLIRKMMSSTDATSVSATDRAVSSVNTAGGIPDMFFKSYDRNHQSLESVIIVTCDQQSLQEASAAATNMHNE